MHAVIENTVSLNSGDAAILIPIIKIMKETFGRETEFSVFDSSSEITRRYYPEIKFYPLTTSLLSRRPRIRVGGYELKLPFRRVIDRVRRKAFWRKIEEAASGAKITSSIFLDSRISRNIDIYRSADVVVSTGGAYLVEHYNLDSRIVELIKDIALGKPLVLFTRSLGPFRKISNRTALKTIADATQLILLRDEKSERNLRDIGVGHDRLKVVADSVFALADVSTLSSLPEKATARPRVAVSVREWSHFERLPPLVGMKRYEEAIVGAVSALVREKGATVEFISTCRGIPEYTYDDSIVAARIHAQLADDIRQSVYVDSAFHSATDLLEKIREFDFVISTRMHMAILALYGGVPVLPIAYEFKTSELYKSLGQEQWITDISAVERETFVDLALRFSDGLAQFREKVTPYIIAQSQSAKSAGAMIASIFAADRA